MRPGNAAVHSKRIARGRSQAGVTANKQAFGDTEDTAQVTDHALWIVMSRFHSTPQDRSTCGSSRSPDLLVSYSNTGHDTNVSIDNRQGIQAHTECQRMARHTMCIHPVMGSVGGYDFCHGHLPHPHRGGGRAAVSSMKPLGAVRAQPRSGAHRDHVVPGNTWLSRSRNNIII